MKKVVFILGLFLLVFISGCTNENSVNPPQNGETGRISLNFDKANAPSSVVNVTATLTREGYTTVTGALNIQGDSTATLLLSGLAVGSWNLKVDASDSANTVLYSGETTILIQAGFTTQVSLTLVPTGQGSGDVYITVNWGTAPSSGWKVLPVDFLCDFHSVYFLNTNKGFAVGTNGTIIMTTNGGNNWSLKNSNTTKLLSSIAFLDDLRGFVVGYEGTLLKTIDGGETWTLVSLATLVNFYSVRFNNSIGIITCGNGMILRSSDSGNSWIPIYLNTDALLLNSSFKENIIYVFGSQTIIAKSTNNGASWTSANPGYNFTWMQSGHFFTPLSGIIIGGGGMMIKTTNGGTSWLSMPISFEHLEEIFFVNNNKGWLVGDHGTIFKTTNQGIAWSKEISNTNNWLNSVYFVTENLGFAAGQNGTILKFTN
ncbi:MAG: WD40/YVTN/BNR-like repeat-containing protein [Ignavibacteriaceae bacterium]